MKSNQRVKNVLITGGTRGLGLEYARFLASKGYNICLTDISKKACSVYSEIKSVDNILKELKSYGIKVFFESADLTDIYQTENMISYFIDKFENIDAVITNAGGDISGEDDAASGGKVKNNSFLVEYNEFNNIFNRNFFTCYNTLRSIVPHLKKLGYGKIITVSSINAAFGVTSETTYSVAKSAILQMTRSLAKELQSHGINVNCIMPGPVETGRFMSTLKGRNSHDLKNIKGKSRLERIAKPEDISPVVEFLISPASDFVSGQVIKIDGGLFNQPI